MGLSSPLLKVLPELGIQNPTEIQLKAIPALLEKPTDFIGLAQTGTGKTAAFGLPLLQLIQPNERNAQALVITPTRELGQQVATQLEAFSKYLPKISVQVVYGGKPIHQQIKGLQRKPQIIVATPGRLIDLLDRRALSLSSIQTVVLDEADEMLNMGFQEPIDKILKKTPAEKKIWLFSATMPPEIRQIISKYMAAPVEVAIDRQQEVNVNIDHQYMRVKGSKRTEAIQQILDEYPDMRAVIFCRTKMETRNLAKSLFHLKYPVDALHGDLTQKQRDKVMHKFKSERLQLLIATDVAARGIDVNNLTHVIHHTLPDDFHFYTHRSGRTARAGKSGISLALVSNSDYSKVKQIEKKLKISFSESDVIDETVAEFTAPKASFERPGHRGERKSGNRRKGAGAPTDGSRPRKRFKRFQKSSR